jgi:hypothetical protein
MEVEKLVFASQYRIRCQVDEFPEATLLLLQRAKADNETPQFIIFSFPEVEGEWEIILTC